MFLVPGLLSPHSCGLLMNFSPCFFPCFFKKNHVSIASYNRRVFNALEARIKKAGGSVTELDITGFPLFNQDLEADKFPKDVTKVKEAIVKADGLLIVSPEYNSGIPAVTKNFLDWCSRGEPSGTFKGKFIALASASPGGLGGRRMHMHMRDVIGMLGGHLHPNILGIPSVFKSVDGVDGPLNGDALEHADKFAVEIVAAAEHFNRPPASRKSSGKK